MKKGIHLRSLTAILLFFTFIFNASLTNARLDKNSKTDMDNTIYQYNDGSDNHYFFYISPAGNCIMEYVPVKTTAAPAGNDNGDMFIAAISMADYNYLVQFLKLAINESTATLKDTVKNCGSVVVITGKEKKYPIVCGSATGRTVEGLVNRYARKYTVVGKSEMQVPPLVGYGSIREQFYESKKGIVTGQKEYFFIPGETDISIHQLEKQYYIKLWGGNVLRDDLVPYAGKKVRVKAFFKWGLWDTNDEQHASRVGNYVTLIEIGSQ